MVLTLQIQQKSQMKFKSKKSWTCGYSFLTTCLSQYQSTKRYVSKFNVYQTITIVTLMLLFLQLSDSQLTQILIDITQLITKIYINMIIVLCKKICFFSLGGIICVVKAKTVKLIYKCKWPSWVNRMWYIYTTENYLTTKSNELLVYFTATIIIEIITLEGEQEGYIYMNSIYRSCQNRKSIKTTKISGYWGVPTGED